LKVSRLTTLRLESPYSADTIPEETTSAAEDSTPMGAKKNYCQLEPLSRFPLYEVFSVKYKFSQTIPTETTTVLLGSWSELSLFPLEALRPEGAALKSVLSEDRPLYPQDQKCCIDDAPSNVAATKT